MQEEMDRALDQLRDFLAGQAPDLLDGRAAIAEDDALVAVARDEDDLFDARRSVLEVLPVLGLDRQLVGQLKDVLLLI